MDEKDIVFLALGFIFGIYASIIAGRVFAFYQLRSDALQEIQLFSAFLSADSNDLKRIPRFDRALELMSIRAMCLGHKNMYERIHCIAEDAEKTIDKVGAYRHPAYVDLSKPKTKWLQQATAIKPNLLPFLTGKEPVKKALSKYAEKEAEYRTKARGQILKYPGTIIPFDEIW